MTTFHREVHYKSIYDYAHKHNHAGIERVIPVGQITATSLTTGTPVSGNLKLLPFVMPSGGLLETASVNVTVGAADSSGIIGLYENISDNTLYPSGLLWDSLPFSTAGTGPINKTVNYRLIPGKLYWIGFGCGNASMPTLRSMATTMVYPIFGVTTSLGTAPGYGIDSSIIPFPTSLPNPLPAGGTVATSSPFPTVFIKVTE